ncbi:MAG: acyl-CoA dehydrogenase, partial [Pseudomonadota bacterium]|nr:acyl-CoA dehydrogenase [Pseudomonadota bacterium]
MALSGEKIGNFSWEDPFLLNEQLNEEERLISETARAFAREKLMPRIV